MAKRETLDLEIQVKGADDVEQLSDDIEDLFKKVDKLTGRPAELLLTAKFGTINKEIADLVLELEKLDSTDPEVEVKIARLNELQGDLDAVTAKLKEVHSTRAEPTVTADTTEAERGIDDVEAGLKNLDGKKATARVEIDTRGAQGGLRKAKDTTEELSHSARGANSALANMFGNAAQDAGEFAGLIGSVGVGIGQMAEYAADATLEGEALGASLKSMALVAGPIAALSVATLALGAAMKAIRGDSAEIDENTRQMTDAFEESIGVLDRWKSSIQEAFEAGTGGGEKFAETMESAMESALDETQFDDLREALAKLGLTFEDLGRLTSDAGENFDNWAAAQLNAAGATQETINALVPLIDKFGSAQAILDNLELQLSRGVDVQPLIDWVEANRNVVDSIDEIGESFDKLDVASAAEDFLLNTRSVSEENKRIVDEAIRSTMSLQQQYATLGLSMEQILVSGNVNWNAALEETIRLLGEQAAAQQEAADANDRYADMVERNRAAQQAARDEQDRMTFTTRELEDALRGLEDPMETLPDMWRILVQDVADGNVDIERAVAIINLLAEATKLEPGEIIRIVGEQAAALDARGVKEFADAVEQVTKVLPGMDALKEAGVNIAVVGENSDKAAKPTGDFVQNITDMIGAATESAAAVADLSRSITQAGIAANSTDFRAGAIGAAFEQLDEFSDLDTAEQLTNLAEAFTAVDDAARGYSGSIVGIDLVPDDWADVKAMPEDLKGITDAIGQFRDAAQVQMAEAFEFGGPGGMRKAAQDMREQFEGPFKAMMERNGATIEEQNDAWNRFMSDVGIAPDKVEIAIELAIDEQKLQALRDIASGAGLTGDRQLAFDIAIQNKDPETALRILNEQLAEVFGKEVILTVNPDTGAVEVAMENLPKELTTEVTAEPVGFTKVSNDLDDVAAPRDTKITAQPIDSDKTKTSLDTVAKPRTAPITAQALVSVANILLSVLARPRTAPVTADAHTSAAEGDLNYVARDRFADIFIRTHGTAAVGAAATVNTTAASSVAAPMALAAAPTAQAQTIPSGSSGGVAILAAPAPVTHTANVTINAGVIGNRFEVQRAVRRALRQGQRLNGRRN